MDGRDRLTLMVTNVENMAEVDIIAHIIVDISAPTVLLALGIIVVMSYTLSSILIKISLVTLN
jgi:hypothetical protein